jgi:hypothetical protein
MKIAKASVDQGRGRMTTGRKALWSIMSSPTRLDWMYPLIASHSFVDTFTSSSFLLPCLRSSEDPLLLPNETLHTITARRSPKVHALIDHFSRKTLDNKKVMIGEIQLMLAYALALVYDQRLLAILPYASVGNYAQSFLASSILTRI